MSFAALLKYQYSNLPISLTSESCQGKTYIVTGANIGLGFECAKHLVQLGASRVILAVRSLARGEAAQSAIESETGIRGVAQTWALDLSSHDSTKQFAKRVEKNLERVDAVVHNAAGANGDWVISDGWESTVGVNVISTLLLTVLLMPHLEACARKFGIKPRVLIVTSGLAFGRKADLARMNKNDILRDVNDPKKWSIDGTNR